MQIWPVVQGWGVFQLLDLARRFMPGIQKQGAAPFTFIPPGLSASPGEGMEQG